MARIAGLLGDREFTGKLWWSWLKKQKIPFYFRIKSDAWLKFNTKKWRQARKLFSQLQLGEHIAFPMALDVYGVRLFVAGSRAKTGDLMVVVTTESPNNAIPIYLRRWEIESMFQSLKGRGFKFEDTHVVDPDRICRLISVMVVGFAWAHKVGEWRAEKKPIYLRKYGEVWRPQSTYFRYGLDFLADAILQVSCKWRKLKKCLNLLIKPTDQWHQNINQGAL